MLNGTRSGSVIKDYKETSKSYRFWNAVATVMQLTARIATGRSEVNVIVKDEGNRAPAWTEVLNRRIVINSASLPSPRTGTERIEAIRQTKGLLYHELAHLFYSPRGYAASIGDGFMDRLLKLLSERGIGGDLALTLWNVLEDKRIENLFIRRYRNARHYIGIVVLELLIRRESDPALQYLNIAGRPWVDRRIFAGVRTKALEAMGKAWIEEVDAVAGSFIRLSAREMNTNTPAVAALIERWFLLMKEHSPDNPSDVADDCDSCKTGSGKPGYGTQGIMNGARTDTLPDEADESLDEADLDKLHEMGQPDADSDTEGDEAEGDDAGETKGKSSASDGEEGETEEASGEGDEADSTPGGTGAGGPGEQQAADLTNLIMEALDEHRDRIFEDIKDTNRNVSREMEKANMAPPSSQQAFWPARDATVNDNMKNASRRIAQKLEEIRTQASPEWLRGESAGRLNLFREVLYGEDRDDVFDLWDEGVEDEMKAHVNLCLDMSSSMERLTDQSGQMLWTLRDAFERVDHTVDIYGFGSNYQRLDERHSRITYPNRVPQGGTAPLAMLKDVVQRSTGMKDVRDRLIVAITDGVWHRDQYETLMDEWRRMGGMSMLFLIGSDTSMQRSIEGGLIHPTQPFGFDEWIQINTPLDCVKPIEKFVQRTMQAHLTRAG